jgi:hypothetical protein
LVAVGCYLVVQKRHVAAEAERVASERKQAAIEAARPQVVKGQIFLALAAGGSVKLAAVDVLVVDGHEFTTHVDTLLDVAKSNLTVLRAEGASEHNPTYRYWKNPLFTLRGEWSKVAFKTTTDADGRFTLQIPKQGNFVIIAYASRKTGYFQTWYGWSVLMKPSIGNELLLNNNNLVVDYLDDL